MAHKMALNIWGVLLYSWKEGQGLLVSAITTWLNHKIGHHVREVKVFPFSSDFWKVLDVYKAKEKFSLFKVWGQKTAKVFSILF